MSTTVTYKSNTLTTVDNTIKTLKTAGKYMEGDIILTDVNNTLVINLSYNDTTEMWEPDCTFAEAVAAIEDGKSIMFSADYPALFARFGGYEKLDDTIHFSVEESFLTTASGVIDKSFDWTSSGVSADLSNVYYMTADATAVPSDVANGKRFYNANGIQTGTATGGTIVIRDSEDSHGGTVREITASSIVTGTKTITENGTYDVAAFADALVDVASSSVDMPVFTVVMAPDFSAAQSVTCSMTFAECSDYANNNDAALVEMSVQGDSGTSTMLASLYTASAAKLTYVVFGGGKPLADVSITSDNICSWGMQPSIVTTLTATANGTYTDVRGRLYSEVTVNVPAPEPELQAKTATPSTSQQVITADSGYDGLSQVTVSAMPSGSATTPTTSITANPSISVNSSTGLITASVSGSKSVTPSVSAGYVSSGTAGTVSVSGSNTSQLTTQAAKTVTPSTSSQTAVAAGRYTTGAVTVAAMPSGTAGTPTATKGTVSNHAISVTPSVTNTTGYITGGTQTGTAVSVSASELVSGTLEVTESGTYDVTNYASASVNVSGGSTELKMGAIRPDAELVKKWTYDRLLVEDEGVTIPAYKTSETSLFNGANFDETVQLDLSAYDYYMTHRMVARIMYSSQDVDTGRIEYSFQTGGVEIVVYPASTYFYGGPSTSSMSALQAIGSLYRLVYYSSSRLFTQTPATRYGVYVPDTLLTSTLSSYSTLTPTLTAKRPNLYIRGHSTYFNSTYWNLIEDIRFQFVNELWRAPKTANINGYAVKSQVDHIIACMNTQSETLT